MCALAAAPRAPAQSDEAPGTALIVRVPGDERIVNPLRAELSSYRFHVLELADRVATRNGRLLDLAAQYSAQAAVRALPETISVELCVSSQPAANAAKSEVVNAGPTRDPAVLAVRITEVMRARGLHLKLPERRPAAVDAGSAPPAASTDASLSAPDVASTSAPTRTGTPARASASEGTPATAGAGSPRGTGTPPSAASSQPQPSAASPTRDAALDSAAAPDVPRPPQPEAREAAAPAPAARPQRPPARSEVAERRTSVEEAAEREREEADDTTVEVERTDESAEAADEDTDRDEPEHSLWQAELAGAVVLSLPGDDGHGFGPSWDVFGQLSVRPFPILSFSVFGLVPIWQPDLRRFIGSATIRTYMVGGFADVHARLARRIDFSVGLGGASLLTSVRGTPHDDKLYTMDDVLLRTAAVLARIGLTWRATSLVHLSVRGLIGFALPDELKVQFVGGETPASWGQPFFALTLGCELAPSWP